MQIYVTGPALAVETCVRRLVALGAFPSVPIASRRPAEPYARAALEWPAQGSTNSSINCRISWHQGSPAVAPGLMSESGVQAATGLMHLHGLEVGRPRRLGLEVGSVTAGLLAAQGVLAALIAGSRGADVSAVDTSVTQAGLLTISQYIARATCASHWAEWSPPASGCGPGPPFPTADGYWVELEVLSAEDWTSFWTALQVPRSDLVSGWNSFIARYSTAACRLPDAFHLATKRCTLRHLIDLAESSGMSLSPLRSYAEVKEERGMRDLAHPKIDRLDESSEGDGRPNSVESSGGCGDDPLPLRGIEVIEATSRVQGPLAGLLLKMLGARVLRVEPPGGDVARMETPLAGDTGAFFSAMNRGKEPLQLHLGTVSGRHSLAELVRDADVFLHNWRAGKASEWELDATHLAPSNKRLVHCHASGWGSFAPQCPPIAMDFLVQAYAGLGEGINPADEPPFPARVLLADVMGGMLACEGALAGLYRREVSGRGCQVETSLLGGAMALQAHVLDGVIAGQETGRRAGRPLWGPIDRPVQTAEGYLALGVEDERELAKLCAVLGVDREGCLVGNDAVGETVVRELAAQPAIEWARILADAGLPCAVVCEDLAGLPRDPRFGGLFDPLGGSGWAPASPWRFAA